MKMPVVIALDNLSPFPPARREPNLMVLLAYARVANIPLESIVDDNLNPDEVKKEIAFIEKAT